MPIYEFYCRECNTLFSFFSKTINTQKIPACPCSPSHLLIKKISRFAVTGKAKETADGSKEDFPIDEVKMEKAIERLAGEAGALSEDNPKQAVNLMRKFTDMTGLKLSGKMEEAMHRIESGENPENVEAEMGDSLQSEDPFILPDKKGKNKAPGLPHIDETLYEM